ncbi:malectin domain-containing carbohydrate-binding protein, partial [Hymenobacter terricola]|uniref:malectin domain-containing carbohydrate-binding protein n=1 Tax=Hymenobacter terricola TaxID=2819236 RepID=UPI001CF47F53
MAPPPGQFNFTPSGLKGVALTNPTSLQFGPDGRLYVSEQGGLIKAFTIVRNAANDYTATATEVISLINQIPNHDDNGALNPTVTTRQVTGLLVKGTAAVPVIYVASSDSRIGGPSGVTTLDTNSGIISQLTRSGSTWTKLDLVRGLPRSEENHSTNGLQLDAQTNTLYVAQGGNTNAGAPSINFNYLTEYALSAAILSVNLTAINAMTTKGTGNAAYKYDLPTLDDPTRANVNGADPSDPFGGNNGLNQAKIVAGGPVQVFSPGYRNPYDVLITKGRKMYTIDNGANQGWGGYPPNEGTANVTNNYVVGEPGSTTPTATEGTVNNLDGLHYIGNLATYTAGSYYAGHPAPTRANPTGAGLYTNDGTTAVFRTSKTGTNPLPTDWPPVATANPIEGDFRMPGVEGTALLTFVNSTNGLAEYTATNFNGALTGTLLACGYGGDIELISLTPDGTNVTNLRDPQNKLNQDPTFASGFGAIPLDITAQGDADVFPGSVWTATYGANAVTVFEPQGYFVCTGLHDANDDDQDHYTNADEMDNGTNPCSAASIPADFDHDFISDRNDPDDDNDGIADTSDYFPLDPANGLATTLPIKYDLFNNFPGTGLFGVGFTGLMSNGTSNYASLYDANNLIAGGAVGAFSIVNTSVGDALGTTNTQQNGFQFGVKSSTFPFTIQGRLLGPFFNNLTPQNFQSQGIYLGNGDQDNYLKIALIANGGVGGIEVVAENAGVPVRTQYALPGGIPTSTLDFFLAVDPNSGLVQPKYAANGGATTALGPPIQTAGPLRAALQDGKAYAVGLIATSRGAAAFTATWDFVYVTADAVTAAGVWQIVTPTAGAFTGREENAFVGAGNKFYLLGGRGIVPVQEYTPATNTWADKAAPPVELNHFQAVTLDGLIYAAGAMNGAYPHEVPLPNTYIFNPAKNTWSVGAAIPAARRRGSAGAVVYNNKIYLVAGITDGHWAGWVPWFDEYDPATNTWRALPDAPRARDHFHATVVNNKLYLAGGRRSSGSTNQVFDLTIPEVDVYDFTAGTWSTLPTGSNLPTPRAGASNVLLSNELLVIGGESSQPAGHKETHALNLTTNTWRRLADLQESRHGTQAIVNNNGVYIAAGSGNQGGSPLVLSQEAFYLFGPTSPGGTALAQSQLTVPAALDCGIATLNTEVTKNLVLTNTGGNQGILVSAIAVSGTASFSYASPFPLPFVVPVGQSVSVVVKFRPTAAGTQTAGLVVTHSGQNGATTTALQGNTQTPVYRLNAGGPQLATSIGTFAADSYFAPAPGIVYNTTAAIAGTTDDALYQTERNGSSFSYAIPVSSGQQYRVVLHFAELYWTAVGQRLFDVSLEGTKVLDNYDIFKKAGAFTSTTETFAFTAADNTLNLAFSALGADGGVDNAKISAIEVYSVGASAPANTPPVANAGPAQTLTLPASSAVLAGAGTPAAGNTIAAYAWSQVSGPAPATLSGAATATLTASALVAGAYSFALVVTDNRGTPSAPSTVAVTVNPATPPGTTALYRLNAGGGALATTLGAFAADQGFAPSPGNTYATTAPIAGTTDDALYQTERYGTNGAMSYALAVPNGTYTVTLHFAELYWTAAGQRVFDVSLEGTPVLSRYDIFRKAGA